MKKQNRIRSMFALLIGTALLLPAASIAQPTVNITRLLDQIAGQELGKRYKRSITPRFGFLEPASNVELSFRLTQGGRYGFVAVGDDNVTDIDLQLVDQDGNMVDEDINVDNFAAVTFDPQQNGVYDLRVIMFGCQVSDCQYAAGVYKR